MIAKACFLTSSNQASSQQEKHQGPGQGRASRKKAPPPARAAKTRGGGAAAAPCPPSPPAAGPWGSRPHPLPGPPQPPDEGLTPLRPYPHGDQCHFKSPMPRQHQHPPSPVFSQTQYPYHNRYNNTYSTPPPRPNGYGYPRHCGYETPPNGYGYPSGNGYSPTSWASCRLEVVPPPIPLQAYLEVGL